ncbi:MAG: hypothetical protein JSU82_16995 [Rhodospirillales bacterium]|nr:MAG: hypothetical protein JSU82_16995 [Rhodospirillales bacterium]
MTERAAVIAACLIALLAPGGCGGSGDDAREQAVDLRGWYDRTEQALVRSLGAPDSVYDMRNGGRILTWRHSRTEREGGELYTEIETRVVNGETVLVPVTSQKPIVNVRYECMISFELDRRGYVVGYTADGNDCADTPRPD